MAVGTGGGAGGEIAPIFWYISSHYSNPGGQIFSTTLLLPHPDSQTFLQPCEGGDPKSDSHEWTPHTISLFSPFRATFLALSRVIESDQAGKTKAKHEDRDVGRSENLWGGHNLLFLAEIGLSDLPKSRGRAPPLPPVLASLEGGCPKISCKPYFTFTRAKFNK